MADETTTPRTHLGIDRRYSGTPAELAPGRARVTMATLPEMAADEAGLVHGGFVFSLADHAAMLAVNDPNVVLGAAECRFLAPVRLGETVAAEARVVGEEGRKRQVEVSVRQLDTESDGEGGEGGEVLAGRFTCFVLDRHVLAEAGS